MRDRPYPVDTAPSRTRRVGGAALLAGAAALVLGLAVAPPDAVQGQWQRLMYLHVPAAWTGYLAFAVVLVASLAYLLGHDPAWDRRAAAAAEIGVAATAAALATGSVWGRAVWGVWWTWDPRLVSTALLLLVYLAYLGLRGLGADPVRDARRAAVLGVVGFLVLPLVHFSVLWWRTLHQPPTFLGAGATAPPVDGRMAAALGVSVLAFLLGAAWLFLVRLRALHRAARPTAGASRRTEAVAGSGR